GRPPADPPDAVDAGNVPDLDHRGRKRWAGSTACADVWQPGQLAGRPAEVVYRPRAHTYVLWDGSRTGGILWRPSGRRRLCAGNSTPQRAGILRGAVAIHRRR